MKNTLFICKANVDRSKTAEDFFSEQFNLFDFRSAGIDKGACEINGSNFISQDLLDWADRIFVMEHDHKAWIEQNLDSNGKEFIVLDIPDSYTYYSIELIEILQRKCNKYFEL